MTKIDLVPNIDSQMLEKAAEDFRRDGYVRIEQPFSDKTAKALHHHLDSEIEWWRTLNQGEKLWDLGPESIAALDGPKGEALLAAVHNGARDGFQFLYDNCRCSDDPTERKKRGLLLDKLLDALNSEAALSLFRAITGQDEITNADGQATRYLPGHFLTAHDDAVEGKNRLVAYVLNLTPTWRTDWGGLLQFHDEFGDVVHGLRPCFNAIHLFQIPKPHNVSVVAPFAGAPRYSVTGWLRSAPK